MLFLKRRLFQNIEDFLEAAAPCKVLRGEAPPRLHIAPRAQEQQSFHNRRLVLGDCHMQWVACTLRGAVKQLPWLLKHMPYQNLGSSGRTLLSFCQDAGATPRMLGFVDVHEAVSLQKGLRHHLEFVVPGSRVPSPRTRQAAFLSLRLPSLVSQLPVWVEEKDCSLYISGSEGNPAAISRFSYGYWRLRTRNQRASTFT